MPLTTQRQNRNKLALSLTFEMLLGFFPSSGILLETRTKCYLRLSVVLAGTEPETLRKTPCLEQTEQGFRRKEARLTGAVGPFLSRQSS